MFDELSQKAWQLHNAYDPEWDHRKRLEMDNDPRPWPDDPEPDDDDDEDYEDDYEDLDDDLDDELEEV